LRLLAVHVDHPDDLRLLRHRLQVPQVRAGDASDPDETELDWHCFLLVLRWISGHGQSAHIRSVRYLLARDPPAFDPWRPVLARPIWSAVARHRFSRHPSPNQAAR